ncbi:zinc ribbon domain-containing protein [Haladaptatus salinisoli]|uniref:zinc ribbon domain-containing protein n=1 Tax=Haladaptatus salinisoli TaxID=2884876 RepID=UPI0034A20B8A
MVEPDYTGQNCSSCGERCSRNTDYFRCLPCSSESHADLNAAANIGKQERGPCTA